MREGAQGAHALAHLCVEPLLELEQVQQRGVGKVPLLSDQCGQPRDQLVFAVPVVRLALAQLLGVARELGRILGWTKSELIHLAAVVLKVELLLEVLGMQLLDALDLPEVARERLQHLARELHLE